MPPTRRPLTLRANTPSQPIVRRLIPYRTAPRSHRSQWQPRKAVSALAVSSRWRHVPEFVTHCILDPEISRMVFPGFRHGWIDKRGSDVRGCGRLVALNV